MPLLSNGVLTLADHAARLDPQGKLPQIVELFAQSNPMLDHIPWIESNLPTAHRTTMRTGLPTVTARTLNGPAVTGKSTTAQVDEGIAMIEAFSEIDVDLAMLNGNSDEFRLSENVAFIEAMNQQMQQLFLYGNAATSPQTFNGLMTRYNSLSGPTSQNVISAGSVTGGDGASILLVGWSPQFVTGIYPKGSAAGLLHEPEEAQIIQSGLGLGTGRLKAYIDRWQWKCGLAVRDWRYCVRLCNIDTSAVVADVTGSTIRLIENMIRMIHRIPNLQGCRPVFYAPRSIRAALDVQALNKTVTQLTFENIGGKLITSFRGIPIYTVDQMLETEATVV